MRQINIQGSLYSLEKPMVLGILNTTPDSFYDGGQYHTTLNILKRAEQILEEGGNIIDVGGYSSRPNAQDVSLEEELKRTLPAIKSIKKHFSEALISIDTFRAEVGRQAIEEGAAIVNDISGGSLDADMWDMVAGRQVPYILMHMRGTPQDMTQHTHYEDIVKDVYYYFSEKVAQLRTLKQKDIILDLGFGFAKTIEQNFSLLRNLAHFQTLELPILIGISRKSMIYKTLETTIEQALNGTTVLHTFALLQGVQFLRVHDVREAVEAIKLVSKLQF